MATMTDRVADWFDGLLEWSDRHDGIMKLVIAIALIVMFVEAYNVIGVGASPTPTPVPKAHIATGSTNPLNLAFVGDSNVVRGAGATTDVLEGGPFSRGDTSAAPIAGVGYIPTFVGRPGMTLNVVYWQTRLATISPAFDPDAVFLNIGINDTQSLDKYDGRIDVFMANFKPTTPVFWPGYPITLEPVAKQTGAHAVNHAWAMAANRWPNLHIVGWGALADGHPEWIDRSDPVEKQVHYTADGYEALAGLEIAALQGVVAGQ